MCTKCYKMLKVGELAKSYAERGYCSPHTWACSRSEEWCGAVHVDKHEDDDGHASSLPRAAASVS